jgi:ABC-type polysaccharide/polyol phosphate export permease
VVKPRLKRVKKLLGGVKKKIILPKASWKALQRYRELIQVLVNRNLSVRYRGSVLGIYWSLLSPLIMTGVYTAIFGAAFASYYDDSLVNYVLAAFTGLVVINFFSASTSQALMSVVGNGALLNKMQLPMSIFPVSIITANVFQFGAGPLALLMVMAGITSRSPVNVVAVILPFIALVLICMGVGFLVSGLFVFFRDLPYFYELVTFALWISSPVFYPSEIVPENVKPFLALNPLTRIIDSLRQIVLSGDFPDLGLVAAAWLSGIILLTVGWLCFRWWKPQFMDLL